MQQLDGDFYYDRRHRYHVKGVPGAIASDTKRHQYLPDKHPQRQHLGQSYFIRVDYYRDLYT